MSRKVVVIMAGHGGKDPGAVRNGYREKDLALTDARAFRDEMNQYEVDVIMLRDSDKFIGINSIRAQTNEIAKKYGVGNTVFVSSHWNSFHDPAATGWEILINFPDTKGDKLADSIVKEVEPTLTITNRGKKYSRGDLGVLKANPATVLIEHCFISNPSDIKKHLANRDNMAKAYARGVANYLGVKEKSNGGGKVSEARIRQIVKEEIAKAGSGEEIKTWAKEGIDYVKKEKIMEGYGDGSWGPNKPVTRAELAKVVHSIKK